MNRFGGVLQKARDQLQIPEPARTRVLLEMASDLEDSYQIYLSQGCDEPEAVRRAEESFGTSEEALKHLVNISWPRWLNVDWWQIVPFLEAGCVADRWNLQELHSDMKWDSGLGVRVMAAMVVVRADFAHSKEGWHIWAMVDQAF